MGRSYSTTSIADNRAVADAEGIAATAGSSVNKATDNAILIDGSGNSIVQTDFGAVAGAFKFAEAAQQNTSDGINAALGVSEKTLDKALKSNNEAINQISEAYVDAKGGTAAATKLNYALMAAVVAIVFFAFTRRAA